MAPLPIAALLALAAWVLLSKISFQRRSKGCPLPPGPAKSWIPFVGNGLQLLFAKKPFPNLIMDLANEFKTDLVMLDSFGHPLILLNSKEAVKELFETRGAIYSSRPPMPLLRTVVSRDSSVSFEPHNETWRRQRKAGHLELNASQAKQYSQIQMQESYILVANLLERKTTDLVAIAERFSGGIAFGSFFDYRVESFHDPMVEEFNKVFSEKMALLSPGASFYDVLPAFLRPYMTEWIMPSLKAARRTRDRGEALDRHMSQTVQDRIAAGEDTDSFIARLLRREKEGKATISAFERDSLSGLLVAAAVDTTQASIRLMILGAICFPEAQKRVQQAIDAVVGRDRLPTTEDLARIPLVKAYVLETMRWRSPSRIASPHCTDKDDWYNGFFLPKGSTIIHNSWPIEHNPEIFPDPETLIPERWLKEDGSFDDKVPSQAFGIGRRVCLGASFAQNSLTMAVAAMFWAISFSKATDDSGRVIEPDVRPEAIEDNGVVFPPKPFQFTLEARDGAVANIVKAAILLSKH